MLQIEKRDKSLVSFNPTKILNRIKKSAKGLTVNADEIFIKVITSMPTEGIISTKELDKLISEISASYTGSHYDYSKLAAVVSISGHQKSTKADFYETMKELAEQTIVSKQLIDIIELYGPKKIEELIDYEKDYNFDYFGWKSLHQMYLLKNSKGKVLERPQHMYMRVSLWVTKTFEEAKEYFESLSNQYISPATPIMINSGTKIPQLASCVLHYNDGDTRQGLLDTLNDISVYSADAAGIGLCMSNIRSKESKIATSGGNAGGLLKYLKMVNEHLRFFNQQGRRPGSAAIYLEPWHKDIFDLLEIKKNTGAEELRARDLFTALWVPDLFMKAVKQDLDWYLFCPNDIKKAGLKPLDTVYGEEFDREYQKAVNMNLGKKVKAQEIWTKIYESQVETGVPYIAYKDNANKKSNHENIGVIKQSNLCIEIFQVSNEDTTAICTLSAIILKNFVKNKKFDFDLLFDKVRKIVRALNKVIDINSYSTQKGLKGGKEQRAIAIGIQGLADTFFLLDLIYTSDEAKKLNKAIAETIYYAAIYESNQLCIAKEYHPYDFFKGSPMSKGVFQFDMWGLENKDLSGLWDWNTLKESVKKNGVCNSLFCALMPTASSAKITGSYEMYEPIFSNIENKRVVGGEFLIICKYLVDDFHKLGLWSDRLKNDLINNNGSIQSINFNKYLDLEDKNYEKKRKRIEHLILKYRTIWEIPQKDLIQMAVDRAPFIDQSQSMNLYFAEPTLGKMTSALFYGWEKGLKTGSYYFRTKPISTGAKHLAIDIEPEVKFKPEVKSETEEDREIRLLNEKIAEEMKNLPPKPEGLDIDCFGCSS